MRDLQLRLQPHHPLSDWQQQRPDLAFVTVEGSGLRALLHRLREEEGFTHLVLLTAVDWLEEGEFQLTYLLCSRRHGYDLGVRVVIDRDQAAMVSVHDLWPTAATYQRELREMFGIDFPGSPGVGGRRSPPTDAILILSRLPSAALITGRDARVTIRQLICVAGWSRRGVGNGGVQPARE